MGGQGQLALTTRFRDPVRGERLKDYREYIIRTLANDVALDEFHELMGMYGCAGDELCERILVQKWGNVRYQIYR